MKGKLIISTAVSLHFVKVERISYQLNHIWTNLKFLKEEKFEYIFWQHFQNAKKGTNILDNLVLKAKYELFFLPTPS